MYQERPSRIPGAVVWSHGAAPAGTGLVLPDGCMDLLLWNGELVVAGPDTRAHEFSRRPEHRITGLRLAPGAGPRVFGIRAFEVRDQRVPLAGIWPAREVRELTERMLAAPDPGAALESVAGRRLAAAAEGTAPGARAEGAEGPLADAVVELLRRGYGVREVAREVGLSERQLHRRCLDAFGYGAKTLARVLRMRRALSLADGGTPLSETAFRAGYADQAHLAREVRALAGTSMTGLIRA
ncbi:helix-turn-helix transcriptional regulator [Streptomyces albiaxialis]|uniref:Helix-turn-helix transcriptional regulator n=1 Tax=Streptomyces albiaxialis TaxID=329523 RepID=A0ABN2WE93_9ACTN